MPRRSLQVYVHTAELKSAFTISRGSKRRAETVRATIKQDGARGRGESVPYARYGETVEGVVTAIEAIQAEIEAGLGRRALQQLVPAGAARCALDCALWDLDAKLTGTPVWQLAGLPPPRPVETAETLALGPPGVMAEAARAVAGRLIKLKLGGPEDLARIEAVHRARPDARLIVDGNEGIAPGDLARIAEAGRTLGLVLIEQPLPSDADSDLSRGAYPVAICGDESAHTAADIPALAARYDAVNVKLDKAGGLTGALDMLRAAKAEGLVTMVGCMVAGSLSLAPAVLAAGLADYADLDGPLWLAEDEAHGLAYTAGHVAPPTPELWG